MSILPVPVVSTADSTVTSEEYSAEVLICACSWEFAYDTQNNTTVRVYQHSQMSRVSQTKSQDVHKIKRYNIVDRDADKMSIILTKV